MLREKGEAWAQKNASWIKAEKININKMAVNAGLGNLYPEEARAQSQQQSRPQPQANSQQKPKRPNDIPIKYTICKRTAEGWNSEIKEVNHNIMMKADYAIPPLFATRRNAAIENLKEVNKNFKDYLNSKDEAWRTANAEWITSEAAAIKKFATTITDNKFLTRDAEPNVNKSQQAGPQANRSQGFSQSNSNAKEEPTHANITSFDLTDQIMKVQNEKGKDAASKLKQDVFNVMEKEGVSVSNIKGQTSLPIIGELSKDQEERYTKMANNLANGHDINKGFTTIDLKDAMSKVNNREAQSNMKANLAKIMREEGVSVVGIKGKASLEANSELASDQVKRYQEMATELIAGKTPEEVKADPKFKTEAKAQQESQHQSKPQAQENAQQKPQPQATQKEQNNSSTQSKQAEKDTKFTPEQQKTWDDLQAKSTNSEDSKKSTQSKTDSPETEHLKKLKLVKRLTNKVKNKVNKIIDKIKGKAHVSNGGTNTPPPAGKNKGKGQSTGNSL
ncbi:MAG: hypothetical protein K0R02_758 [Rickettsiaceae bacterium]|nr:hypothetical protein [Rickettsiaceae bacterium]